MGTEINYWFCAWGKTLFASPGTEFNGFVRGTKHFLLPRGLNLMVRLLGDGIWWFCAWDKALFASPGIEFNGFVRGTKHFVLSRGLNLMVLCVGQNTFCFLGD